MTRSPATRIAYDRAGPVGGPGVVLLHAGVADRRMWDPQWTALTAEYDVVRLDLRGFGESAAEPAAAWAGYRDVADTLDALEIAAAALIGCSLGAGVAVEVALARPDLVSSLLLVSPGGALIEERTAGLAEFAAAESEALGRGDLEAAVQANLDWWVDGPGVPGRVPPEVREAVRIMQRRAFEITEHWTDDREVELEPPAIARYAQVGVPTLLLVGGLDLDAIHAAAARLATGIPGARRVDWPDTAHLPSMERPDDFTDLARGWLRAHAPR